MIGSSQTTRPLQVRGEAPDPLPQGLLGRLLQVQVHGGDHIQAALFQDVRPEPLLELGADPSQVLGRLRLQAARDGLGLERLGLLGGDELELQHAL